MSLDHRRHLIHPEEMKDAPTYADCAALGILMIVDDAGERQLGFNDDHDPCPQLCKGFIISMTS